MQREFYNGMSKIRISKRLQSETDSRSDPTIKPAVQVLTRPGIQVLSREEPAKESRAHIPGTSGDRGYASSAANTASKVLPSPKETSDKEMLEAKKLIGEGMIFDEQFLEFLTENPYFPVTAAIGPQNAGKSTILSMLAGNNPQDKYRYYVFRPASREAVESSRYQTMKIYAYVSKSRGIYLDCQLLRTAEMIRANMNYVSSSALPQLNFLRKTNIVFVHTRASAIDFHYPIHRERVLLIRSLFSDSIRLRISENDELALMMLAILKPRKDTTTQIHAPPQVERMLDSEEIVPFEEGIREMRVLIAGLPRDLFSEQPFTEKQWFLLAKNIWHSSSFNNALDQLSNSLQ